MKYKEQIEEAYNYLGFTPRGNQLADISLILTGFLDEGFKTQILSAPTGTGKSIIGAITAEVLHKIRAPDVHHGASFLLSPTNILSEQYHNTFQKGRDPLDTRFRMLKGASNFTCAALSTPEEPQTAEHCAIRMFQKADMLSVIADNCDSCEFALQKRMRDKARHLITNYSYYFVDRMYLEILAKRTVTVFDEAHMINDLFTEHNAIYFSDSRLKKMVDEIGEHLSIGHRGIFKIIKEIKEAMNNGEIEQHTYMKYLGLLADVYGQVTEAAQLELERCNPRNQTKYMALSKLSKKYFGLGCKISDLMIYDYPHAFEYKEKNPKEKFSEDEVSVKPIFVGEMFDKLINAEFNLLMSATLSEQYARRTMTLENAKHIRLAPSFPRENKKVVFYKPQNLNQTTLKTPVTIKALQSAAYEIAAHHSELGHRGVVLAPSFALTGDIAAALEARGLKARIYEHQRGEKLAEVLGRFTRHADGPAILLTPSGFEGLDLVGDLSRYQIILKAPFGSLGEARMKKILAVWPDIYSLMTLSKLVQGAGRSVRSAEDFATTYMLDSNIQRLWTSKQNEWSNEFQTSFSSILS